MGLGIPMPGGSVPNDLAQNGITFYKGIELQGIENLDIRLAGGDDDFTVADTGFTRQTNGQPSTTRCRRTCTLSGGAGNDTINLQQVGGPTRIIGGDGADTVNIHSGGSAQTLAQILSRVTFDGDGTVGEHPIDFLDNDPRLQIFLTTPSVILSVPGTEAITSDASHTHYFQAQLVPVLADHNTTAHDGSTVDVWVVSLDGTGAISTQWVQEKGSLETAAQKTDALHRPLYFDNAGQETTDSSITGVPVLVAGSQQVYVDAAFNKVLTATGNHLSYVTDFLHGINLCVDDAASASPAPRP